MSGFERGCSAPLTEEHRGTREQSSCSCDAAKIVPAKHVQHASRSNTRDRYGRDCVAELQLESSGDADLEVVRNHLREFLICAQACQASDAVQSRIRGEIREVQSHGRTGKTAEGK